jgi:uncharacterized membrane protein YdjX (TVP38/TMEM64 family)
MRGAEPSRREPGAPLELDAVIDDLAAGRRRETLRRIAFIVATIALLVGLASVWLFTPLRGWLDLHHLVAMLGRWRDSPLAPFVMLAAFVVGGLFVAPVNLLIAVCMIVFGPWPGVLYALVGTELSALLLYEIGRRLPTGTLRERLGDRVRGLRARLLRHGLLAIALVRLVPVAPFSLVNVVAGAAHVPRTTYLAGTALGMLPGVIFSALFIDRVVAAIEHPGPLSFTLLLAAAAVILLLMLMLRRRLIKPSGDAS